ncbi:MAG: YceI family protein [Pseudomonadota bacterium]
MNRSQHVLTALLLASSSIAFAEPEPLTLDLGHAYFGWEIDHFEYSNTVGQFREFDGSFVVDTDNLENSEISFVVQTASIASNHSGRDNHLRAADLLNANEFPTIEFISTDIEMSDDAHGVISGDLTFMGTTMPFSMAFQVTGDAKFAAFLPRYGELRAIGIEAEGRLDRLAHGFDALNFPGSPLGQYIDLDVHFDLVDCESAKEDNIPCQYGRNETLEFPHE